MQKRISDYFPMKISCFFTLGLVCVHAAFALRDPTMPPTAWQDNPVVHVNAINLQGIFQTGKSIHAVLNGTLVYEGDRFQQWVVKSIFSDRVILENKAGEMNFVYLSDAVKSPAKPIIQKGNIA